MLEHRSEIPGEPLADASLPLVRQVGLVIKAVAFGALAEQLSRLPLAVLYSFSGYLTNVRGGKGVVFQLQEVVA